MSASRSNERDAPDKSVMWIHVPDWTDQGKIRDIRNVTNLETQHADLWNSIAELNKQFPTENDWLAVLD